MNDLELNNIANDNFITVGTLHLTNCILVELSLVQWLFIDQGLLSTMSHLTTTIHHLPRVE